MPPVRLHWYQGEEKPEFWTTGAIPKSGRRHPVRRGQGDGPGRLRQARAAAREGLPRLRPPEPSIPKSLGHHAEWVHACKTGAPTTCNFEYAGWLTEANHLGNVAYRAGKKLQWDPAKLSRHQRPRGRAVHPPRISQGMDAGVAAHAQGSRQGMTDTRGCKK